jgi:hypothetical protein
VVQVLDLCVTSRIYQGLVTVLSPANHIGGLTMISLDLDNLTVSLGLSYAMAFDYQPVALLSSHIGLLLS